jgi:radical SAM superfamily enzyme YgiQ (UPF0313 family)
MKILVLDLGRFNADKSSDVQETWHNHGAGMVATFARQKGIEVDYGGIKYMSGLDDLESIAKSYGVVAMSVMSSQYPQASAAAQFIKNINRKCRIIAGGIHATVSPADFLSDENFDFTIQNEGEVSFVELMENIETTYVKLIPGRQVINLDELPFLDREIYPQPLEKSVELWKPGLCATIITARGCPHNCTFCQPAERLHFGSRIRRRSVKNVISEIGYICRKYSPGFFVFYDDTFFYDFKWLWDFLLQYKKYCVPFIASARADWICENIGLLSAFKKAGLEILSIGFESGSDRILSMTRKGTTVEKNLKAAGICGNLGIRVFANIMYGFPGETHSEQIATHNMVKKIRSISDAMISPAYFTPFPGSELGKMCELEGISLVDNTSYTRFGRDKIKGIDYDWLDKFILT